MFILVFVTNVLINVDHGSLTGCILVYEDYLKISDAYFGLIGSVVYAG